ncbi:MAG TPA: hypothetical protein VFZ26_15375 [Gemmatimonadales bacterium]
MRMRTVTSCWLVLLLVACGRSEERPAEAVGEATTMEEAPAGSLALADMAGTWKVRSTVEGDESTVVTYDMVTTADRSGWSIQFPGREPIPVRVVAVEGDSVVSEAGPFESQLRKGVQVRTNVVSRMQDGKLVGTVVARYDVTGADSVARLNFEGTRAP